MQTKYDNIYATGDCAKNQTQRSFFSGLSQNHVIRYNLLQSLKGKSPLAEYDGHSKVYIPLDYKKCAIYESKGFGEENEQVQEDVTMGMRKYSGYAKGEFKKLIKGKSFGAPDHTKKIKNEPGPSKETSSS